MTISQQSLTERPIIGLDTATSTTAVALCLPDGQIFEARDDPCENERLRHATNLLGSLETVLRDSGLSWNEIGKIAVGVGPGSFTGLRIGVATARALAQSLSIELIPVSSLEALAAGFLRRGGFKELGIDTFPDDRSSGHPLARKEADPNPHESEDRNAYEEDDHKSTSISAIAAMIDARRGEIFSGMWSVSSLKHPLKNEPALIQPGPFKPQDLVDEISKIPMGIYAIGDGVKLYRQHTDELELTYAPDSSPLNRISAVDICRIGQHRSLVSYNEVLPSYLRLPDAKPPAQRSLNKRKPQPSKF